MLTRYGKTWVCTASEPLSYEPAGSRVVTLSVVPTMIASLDESPVASDEPPPAQPARRSVATPSADAAPTRRARVE